MLLAPLVNGAYSKTRLALSGLIAIPGAVALLSTGSSETAIGRYVGTAIDAAGAGFRVGLLVVTASCFFLVLRRKWATVFPQDYKLVVIGSMLMMALVVLVPISSVISDRLAYYLIPIQTMIFARVPYLPIRATRPLFIAAPYLVLMLVLAVWMIQSKYFLLCYTPYQSWLFGFPASRY